MARKRTSHSPQFKAKVALEAAREQYTISELARKYSLHPNLIRGWKKQLVAHLPEIFQRPGSRTAKEDETALIPELYQQIGRLQVELEWLKKNTKLSVTERRAMIEAGHERVSVARQCALLGLSRSSYYYRPRPPDPLRPRAHARPGSPLHPLSLLRRASPRAGVATRGLCRQSQTRTPAHAGVGSAGDPGAPPAVGRGRLAPNLPLSAAPAGDRSARPRMGSNRSVPLR